MLVLPHPYQSGCCFIRPERRGGSGSQLPPLSPEETAEASEAGGRGDGGGEIERQLEDELSWTFLRNVEMKTPMVRRITHRSKKIEWSP